MTLIRRHKVEIEEVSLGTFRARTMDCVFVSFWGHENTRAVAESLLQMNLIPKEERPSIMLDEEGYPSLDGERFKRCYVFSPDIGNGSPRASVTAEASLETIYDWHMLQLTWL